METDELVDDAARRMTQAVEVFSQGLQAMRTGRPVPELIEDLPVQCYNSSMPLKQVASVTVEEGRTLLVQVWDKQIIEDVERAIRVSPLDLNPTVAGDTMRIAMPPLSEEMRHNLVRQARAEAEKARISVRNVRRDCMTRLKSQDGSQDAVHDLQAEVQKITDSRIADIDTLLEGKEASLMQV